MRYLKVVLPAILLALSTSVSATTYTYGNLTSDDTTNFIKDTVTGREYLRFDTFNLSVADTFAAVGTGGLYDGWSIATSDTADDFYAAILGVGSTPCSGATPNATICGTLTGWVDGAFGESLNAFSDWFWYLSTNETPYVATQPIGIGAIRYTTSTVQDYDDWGSYANTDYHGITDPSLPINAMLYRDVSPVPVPAAAWLFGSALLGFFGFSRRKASA